MRQPTGKQWNRAVGVCLGLLCLTGAAGGAVSAQGSVYQFDRSGTAVPSQAGYAAERTVSGEALGCGALYAPQDLFRDPATGRFYLADTGNHRIVVVDAAFSEAVDVLETFTLPDGTQTTLQQPEGVTIAAASGLLYIADTGNARILVADPESCRVQQVIERPAQSSLYQNESFLPQKVTVDAAGNVYVVLEHVTGGVARFDAAGTFCGYFGANAVQPTAAVLVRHFWNRIATDAIRAATARTTAAGVTNFDLDEEGFLFTVSQSEASGDGCVKKVTPGGRDLFSGSGLTFGDRSSDAAQEPVPLQLVDVDVEPESGRFCCLDAASGRIFQYDAEGTLLFVLGGQSGQLGGFSLQPSAVESDPTHIYVADRLKQTVTVFTETPFGAVVQEASAQHRAGRYAEALEPWLEVLRRDGNYRAAYTGIAAAKFRQGDYAGAMDYAAAAEDSVLYNKAFQSYRAIWLRAHVREIGAAVVCLAAGLTVRRIWKRQRRRKER